MLKMIQNTLLSFAASVGFGIASLHAAGPDIIVGRIWDFKVHGIHNGILGGAFGTESCNVGDIEALWIADDPNHPVIALNLFRLKEGRFEQIGMSWVKHAFAVSAGDLCRPGGCTNPGLTDRLAVGCSDPYSANLNGNQSLLGPRHEINAASGEFVFSTQPAWPPIPPAERAIGRRLQVQLNDVIPERNAGAFFFAEAQYVSADDAKAGNGANNVSYRPVRVVGATETAASLTFDANTQTVQEQSAVMAWREADPAVEVYPLDVKGDGRLMVAIRRTPASGRTRVAIALQNLTSDRSVRSLTVLSPGGEVDASTVGFHDVAYHSGDGIDGKNINSDDWIVRAEQGSVTWSTKEFSEDPNANALRWGTTYSFWFEATTPPASIVLELFKPGTPEKLELQLPPSPTGFLSVEKPEVDLGRIIPGVEKSPAFIVRATPPASCKLKALRSTMKASRINWKARPEEPGAWEVSIGFASDAQPGPFEATITVESDAVPASAVKVRIYGEITTG